MTCRRASLSWCDPPIAVLLSSCAFADSMVRFVIGWLVQTLDKHTGSITALDFSEPYGTLVTASSDESVRVWDLCSGEEIGYLRGHEGTSCSAFLSFFFLSSTFDLATDLVSVHYCSLSQASSRPSKSTTNSASPEARMATSSSGTFVASRITRTFFPNGLRTTVGMRRQRWRR
jgi:WD40 repeat protein